MASLRYLRTVRCRYSCWVSVRRGRVVYYDEGHLERLSAIARLPADSVLRRGEQRTRKTCEQIRWERSPAKGAAVVLQAGEAKVERDTAAGWRTGQRATAAYDRRWRFARRLRFFAETDDARFHVGCSHVRRRPIASPSASRSTSSLGGSFIYIVVSIRPWPRHLCAADLEEVGDLLDAEERSIVGDGTHAVLLVLASPADGAGPGRRSAGDATRRHGLTEGETAYAEQVSKRGHEDPGVTRQTEPEVMALDRTSGGWCRCANVGCDWGSMVS